MRKEKNSLEEKYQRYVVVELLMKIWHNQKKEKGLQRNSMSVLVIANFIRIKEITKEY